MYVSLLGRQPELSMAELESVFGKNKVTRASTDTAIIDAADLNLNHFGGVLKYGKIVHEIDQSQNDGASLDLAARYIVNHYTKKWQTADSKITLGISAYNLRVSPRSIQKIGLELKSKLKKSSVSLRLIPNQEIDLSTATSHNNRLGLSENKVELIIIKTWSGKIIIAQSCGVQNINAYTKRDRERPKRDAFVGMLPPKLAQIMINLATGQLDKTNDILVLDPFCGTGTVLQEALLRDFNVYGSDINPKMIDFTRANLDWLKQTHKYATGKIFDLEVADATTASWKNAKNISAVVCETYLGQPFSAPPSPEKLEQVVGNCNNIISQFLRNISPQLNPEAVLCIAAPAWQDKNYKFTHLPLIKDLAKLGYKNITPDNLFYFRPDQVVARQILVLKPMS